MALYKRGNVWWYEFVYKGKRIRQRGGTKKTIAAEAEDDHYRRLERASAGMPAEHPEQRIRTVSEVLKDYERRYGVNHRPRAKRIVVFCNKHLTKAFATTLLPDVTTERLLDYMAQRVAFGASNRTINMEIAVLARAIGSAWKALWPKLKKLEENRDVGRALEPEEEARMLEAAKANSSKLIYPFLVTLAWTGMRSSEARTLRWSQVDFEGNEVVVGKAKTEAGTRRVIPMSAILRTALEQHAAFCTAKLGPVQPEWYIFPFSSTKKLVDATRPVTSIKTAWETVRKVASVECRLHDLRHSFCTKLGEAGVPESTMLDMMGHVSPSMLRRYSHIRAKARREAITALENRNGVPTDSPTIADSSKKAK